MRIEALWQGLAPWQGAIAAALGALGWGAGCRLLRRPGLAALALGIGIAAGWVLILGLPGASPRFLPERLPPLALGAALAALLLLPIEAISRAAAVAGCALAALATGWWIAGTPLTVADLHRALVPLLATALLAGVVLLQAPSPRHAAAALAALAGGLWLAAAPGPWRALATAALAASCGALAAGGPHGLAGRLPAAVAIAALAAGPVIGRGSAPDWTAAAAPFAALLGGPLFGARLGGPAGAAFGWIAAAALPLVFTWILLRGG